MLLKPHPDTPSAAELSISVTVERTNADALSLHYVLSGEVDQVQFPAATHGHRADGLWQTTCFEAFLHCGEGDPYHEFNFAPSGDWAAYRFHAYREGMQEAALVPTIAFDLDNATLTATIQFPPGAATWHLGLSAVIEEKSGRKSYWALAHPPGKPDFHHRDCFVLDLPAAKAP